MFFRHQTGVSGRSVPDVTVKARCGCSKTSVGDTELSHQGIETERDVERLFIRKAAEYKRDPERRNELHLTDLIYECPRQLWFEKKNPLPPDLENILRMWQGTAMHEMPLLDEHELELECEEVKTRIDEYGNGILIEKKFVNFVPKDRDELNKYYSHYIKQVEYEALILKYSGRDVKKAFLLFVRRGEPEPNRIPIRAFEIPLDFDSIASRFIEDVEACKILLSSDSPPEIPREYSPFEYPCTYCQYRSRCFMGEG